MAIYSRIPVPRLISSSLPPWHETTHIPNPSESSAATICLYSRALSGADTVMLMEKLAEVRRRDAKQSGICLRRWDQHSLRRTWQTLMTLSGISHVTADLYDLRVKRPHEKPSKSWTSEGTHDGRLSQVLHVDLRKTFTSIHPRLTTKRAALIEEVPMMLTPNNNVVNGPIQALKEKLPGSVIKKYNDYKCSAPFRWCQCHCCCYPPYQSSWLIIPLWWHQFYGLWNASQCFHNAIQLGYSIHHWAAESLLIGWRADCHSPAEEGYGFWRSDRLENQKT